MHVRSQGFLTLSLNIVMKDFKRMGYDSNPHSLSVISEFPLKITDSTSIQQQPLEQLSPENTVNPSSRRPSKPEVVVPRKPDAEKPTPAKVSLFQGAIAKDEKSDGSDSNGKERQPEMEEMQELNKPGPSTMFVTATDARPDKVPRRKLPKIMDTVDEIVEEPEHRVS